MAEAQILPVADLRQYLPRLGNFLSKADFDRLTAILPFFKPQQASKALLSACLDAIAMGRTPRRKWQTFALFDNAAAGRAQSWAKADTGGGFEETLGTTRPPLLVHSTCN